MYKINRILALLIVLLYASCQDNGETPSIYRWSKSDVIPPFDLIWKSKIEGNNSLYVSAAIKGTRGIYQLDGNTWTKLIETDNFAEDFAVYKGVLYFVDPQGLFYRVVNSVAEKLNTADTPFYAIEVFKDKLIITGFSIPIGGKSYKMASFDGSNFTPISDQYFGFNMLVANDKLFIHLGSVMQYDDTGFRPINIGGNSNIATDDEGSLYIASNTINAQNKYVCSIQKYSNGKTTTLGENLNCFIQFIQFYNGAIVISGDVEQKTGVSYYFKNNKWIKIETSYLLSDMIVYNNELIGSPIISGQALTLELK